MEILLEEKLAEENEFLPGLTCASIYEIKDKKKSKRIEPTDAVNNAIEAVNILKSKIHFYQVEDVNPVIRALGRRRLVTPIFELLDCMRAAGKYVHAYMNLDIYSYYSIFYFKFLFNFYFYFYFNLFYQFSLNHYCSLVIHDWDEYSPPSFVTLTPGLAPNDESLEFLANALVVTVSEEARAKTMRDLPEPDVNMPEVRTYVCLVQDVV